MPRCRPICPLRALEVLGDTVQLLNGYGLTETTSAVVTNLGIECAAHPDSVGRPNLTADLRVVGPDGTVLDVGEIGELCFRSPQVVKGYWNDEVSTRAVFDDGWFHSGDIGYVDADGFVYVVDRIKDVVIRGGENVYCVEVEAVLHDHPDVVEVAVVGMREPVMGERVCAVVVRASRHRRHPGCAARVRRGTPRRLQVPGGARTSPTSCRRRRRPRWRRTSSATGSPTRRAAVARLW